MSHTLLWVCHGKGEQTQTTFITSADNAQSDKHCLYITVQRSISFGDMVVSHHVVC